MQDLTETAVVVLATMFAAVEPLDVAVVFASLTGGQTPRERRWTALIGGGAICLPARS